LRLRIIVSKLSLHLHLRRHRAPRKDKNDLKL